MRTLCCSIVSVHHLPTSLINVLLRVFKSLLKVKGKGSSNSSSALDASKMASKSSKRNYPWDMLVLKMDMVRSGCAVDVLQALVVGFPPTLYGLGLSPLKSFLN